MWLVMILSFIATMKLKGLLIKIGICSKFMW